MKSLKNSQSQLAHTLLELKNANMADVLNSSQLNERLQGVTIPNQADAVFEGGGVKGIALAGALSVAENRGVKWQSVAGTSAGAITACLIASGYTASELTDIVTKDMDFNKFMDEGLVDKIPFFGKIASALFEKGIYEGDYFENWIADKLAVKGVRTFGDVKNSDGSYRLKLLASDVTQRKMLVLPDDLADYERDPDYFSIARAARMSMSIPYFFEPVTLDYLDGEKKRRKAYVVDGGLLSNFPVWLFDVKEGKAPKWPTYGFKLVEPDSDKPAESNLPHEYVMALINTMMDAHDKAYIKTANFARTIGIPTMGIQTTQFDINTADKSLLIRAGQEAAIEFFKEWDFNAHNVMHRS